MRDPERIPIILEELERLWKAFPDWRFGQLITNLLIKEGTEIDSGTYFYIEDNILLEKIRERGNVWVMQWKDKDEGSLKGVD